MFLIWTVYNTYKYMLVLCIKCKRMTTEKKGRKKEIKGHTQSCHQRRVFHSLFLFFIAAFPCDFFVAVQKHKKKRSMEIRKNCYHCIIFGSLGSLGVHISATFFRAVFFCNGIGSTYFFRKGTISAVHTRHKKKIARSFMLSFCFF